MRLLFLKICFFLIVSCILSNCDKRKQQLKSDLENLKSKSVEIPFHSLQKYVGKTLVETIDDNKRFKLVIYTDSNQCSSCALKSMYYHEAFLDSMAKYDNIDAYFIFSPKKAEIGTFKRNMLHNNFTYPIYIDTCNSFLKQNSYFPQDPRFHTVLVNDKDSIILVGNPMRNKK